MGAESRRERHNSVNLASGGAAQRRLQRGSVDCTSPPMKEPRMSEAPAKLLWNGKEIELPVVRGTRERVRDRHLEAARPDRADHPRLRLHEHRLDRVGDHVHRRRRGHPALPRLRHRRPRRTGAPVVPRDRVARHLRRAPDRGRAHEFSRQIRLHTLVHEDVKRFYYGFPKDAHPMATTASVVNALATFYQDSEDPHDPDAGAALDRPPDGEAARPSPRTRTSSRSVSRSSTPTTRSTSSRTSSA